MRRRVLGQAPKPSLKSCASGTPSDFSAETGMTQYGMNESDVAEVLRRSRLGESF